MGLHTPTEHRSEFQASLQIALTLTWPPGQGHPTTLLKSLPYVFTSNDIPPDAQIVSAKLSLEARSQIDLCIASTLVSDIDFGFYQKNCKARRINTALEIENTAAASFRLTRRFRMYPIFRDDLAKLASELSEKTWHSLSAVNVAPGKTVFALNPKQLVWLRDVQSMWSQGEYIEPEELQSRSSEATYGIYLKDTAHDEPVVPISDRPFALTQSLPRPESQGRKDLLITMMSNVSANQLPSMLRAIYSLSDYEAQYHDRSIPERIIHWNPDPTIVTQWRALGGREPDESTQNNGLRGAMCSWVGDETELEVWNPEGWAFMI